MSRRNMSSYDWHYFKSLRSNFVLGVHDVIFVLQLADDIPPEIEVSFLDVADDTCLFDRLDFYEGRTSRKL
jgi:hypothetical protein